MKAYLLVATLFLAAIAIASNARIVQDDPSSSWSSSARLRRPLAIPDEYENEQYFATVEPHPLNITDLMRFVPS